MEGSCLALARVVDDCWSQALWCSFWRKSLHFHVGEAFTDLFLHAWLCVVPYTMGIYLMRWRVISAWLERSTLRKNIVLVAFLPILGTQIDVPSSSVVLRRGRLCCQLDVRDAQMISCIRGNNMKCTKFVNWMLPFLTIITRSSVFSLHIPNLFGTL